MAQSGHGGQAGKIGVVDHHHNVVDDDHHVVDDDHHVGDDDHHVGDDDHHVVDDNFVFFFEDGDDIYKII